MSLTQEDKDWIGSAIRTIIRDETRDEIHQSEQRTAAAIEATETKLLTAFHQFRDEIHQSEQRTAAAIEVTETKLLTAFHQWASPMDARMRTHAAAIRALDLETEALSDRVSKLEPPR